MNSPYRFLGQLAPAELVARPLLRFRGAVPDMETAFPGFCALVKACTSSGMPRDVSRANSIASCGHKSAQTLQPWHLSGFTRASSSPSGREIAIKGHRETQRPHPVHLSESQTIVLWLTCLPPPLACLSHPILSTRSIHLASCQTLLFLRLRP